MNYFSKLLLVVLSTIVLFSCNEDNIVNPNVDAISTEESLEIISENISEQTDGLMAEVSMMTAILPIDNLEELPATASGLSDYCGETQTYSDSQSFEGPNIQWSHSFELSRTLVCTADDEPRYFDVSYTADGSFQNNQVSAMRDAIGQWQVTRAQEFTQENQIIVFNGDYTRDIEREQLDGDRGHNIHLEVEGVDVKKNRSTGDWVSGTLLFTKTGQNNNGNSFSVSGTIVIHDDCTATVTTDNGNVNVITIC